MAPRMAIPPPVLLKLQRLRRILKVMGKVLVAFSGGVDSSLLVKIAADVLGKDVLAVIASSETYPSREVEAARRLARRLGVNYLIIKTAELQNPDFTANSPLRCYHCKQELFSKLKEIAAEKAIPYVLDGSNYEDRSDYRPGAKAGRELGVRSPLREARLNKAEIRLLSKALGLPTWNKPSLACLASRFPYDTPIEIKTLIRLGRAEDFLRRLGFRQLRVRHHGETARLELEAGDFPRAVDKKLREKIARYLKKLGWTYVSLDLEGYRTGSMNEPLRAKNIARFARR